MTPKTLSPSDASPEALNEHVRNVARCLKLTKEQTVVLVAELRNAIAPAMMNLGVIEQNYADFDQEGLETMRDIKGSHKRVIAFLNALADAAE
jgi:hypothetical protein